MDNLREQIAAIIQQTASRGAVTPFTHTAYTALISEQTDAILAIPEIKDALGNGDVNRIYARGGDDTSQPGPV